MAPTIYDIAREAKVGIGTVSRVFNNHPSVSDETRKRVMRVATRMNYHPHPLARGLAQRRTNAILVFVPFFTSFFFVEILEAVQSTLSEVDCDLILHGITHPDHAEISLRRNSFRGRVDGILFFSMRMPEEFAAEYAHLRVPVVLVDTHDDRFDSFSVQNVHGGMGATEHLIRQGHTRIGMLNASLDSPPARERLAGFRQAMRDARLPLREEWILSSPSGPLDGFTKQSGQALMKQLLSLPRHDRPSALVVSSDIQAIGALQELGQSGLRCPDDIAVTGFDDIEIAAHFNLTTIRQPMSEMGALAARRLLERMKDPEIPVVQKTFEPELIVRGTTAVPPVKSTRQSRRA